MGIGCTRTLERSLAAAGKLHEAPSRFESAMDVSHGGLLCALPALLRVGLLEHVRAHFTLPKGFYGLQHIFLLVSFMALMRVKTNEQLRYHAPGEWGVLMGLDRIPEVRTLRKKLKHLASHGEVSTWSAELSKHWMEADPEAAGVLYVDGHVRVYHGSQTKLPKRYVARERLCLRGLTDYWVNDQEGRPFFAIGTPFTDGLLAMLRDEIVPRLLKEVPHQPTEDALRTDARLARFTLVFDREGYSPAFFREMWEGHRIACLSYRKNVKEEWKVDEFREERVAMSSGEAVTMRVAERGLYLGEAGKGQWVREIRKLTESGHQTAVISTDFKMDPVRLGIRLFARWSQENFFRYMRQHFALDRVATNELKEVDETKCVVNPAYREVSAKIRKEAAKLGRLKIAFADLTLGDAPKPKEVESYSRKKGEILEDLEAHQAVLSDLKQQRGEMEKHLPLEKLPEAQRFKQQCPSRRQFVDTIKMIAYRAETAMTGIVREHLARAEDARALIREILSSEADLLPDEKAGTLTIRLHCMANPLSNRAAKALLACLNESETVYPGTKLLLKYELVSS
jgi:prepilin-type processing-associated H-X9-DG protein